MEPCIVRLANFREDVNGKQNEIMADLKKKRDRAEEALQHVSDMEEWTAVAKEVLLETLSKQVQIQAKLTDLETCSRRKCVWDPRGYRGKQLARVSGKLY